MTKRVLIITVVILALLQGALGNVVAAAFCPRFASGGECPMHLQLHPAIAPTETQTVHSCHGDDSATKTTRPHETNSRATNPVVMPSADETCSHCISHSQTNPGRYSATAGDPASSTVENELPLIALDNFDYSVARPLRTLDHGPPGQLRARLALLNTFRI